MEAMFEWVYADQSCEPAPSDNLPSAEQIEDWSDLIDNTPEDSECSIMSKALQMLLQAKDDEYSKEKSKEKATQSKDEPESIRKFRKELR